MKTVSFLFTYLSSKRNMSFRPSDSILESTIIPCYEQFYPPAILITSGITTTPTSSSVFKGYFTVYIDNILKSRPYFRKSYDMEKTNTLVLSLSFLFHSTLSNQKYSMSSSLYCITIQLSLKDLHLKTGLT